jgi:glutamine synthetase
MTGYTAEKHDSFICPVGQGAVIMEFSGKELVKGEPDASRCPSGGIRATFDARGYTAWDPNSFAFIKDNSLYIPTVFLSYGGQALDKKTPLLRSIEKVNQQALRILRLFGDTETKRVIPQVGAEQEYFLIDKDVYDKREDLRLTGRTLFGNMPPRGQELSDHYFGQLKPRVSEYMRDLDNELWKVGVLSKTKHNEVAPGQHEMAPIYTDCNASCDQNQLAMELMKKVALRHNLVCLIHEKPFAGVNGSGKHDNWSLGTDTGKNLFKPGSTPSQNAQFLLFLAAFIKGIDEYQTTLRCTVASAGNDHRLGAQEAPPAVLSIFLGSELEHVIKAIINGTPYKDGSRKTLKIGIDSLPQIRQDTTDRNRTSPMAFTGNKFEFRMLGSAQSVSGPNIALNTIMAEELKEFADKLEKSKNFQADLQKLIKKTLTDHQRIIFEGDGYDDAWLVEAEKRGLKNYPSTAEAIPHYDDPENIALYVNNDIYTEEEMHARRAIHEEIYNAQISIEARTMSDMIRRQILPAVSEYATTLADRIAVKKDAGFSAGYEAKVGAKISTLSDKLQLAQEKIDNDLKKKPADATKCMKYSRDTILKDMNKAREIADQLEELTDIDFWLFPVFSEMLFSE